MASLLNFRHKTLAEIKGDGAQQGDLNRLAQSIRDRVNQTWPPPAASFFVSSAAPGSIAQTIAVNPALTASSLSAVESGPPVVANGKALQLAALANPTQSADKINGTSYMEFYGQVASGIGSKLNDAKFNQESQAQLSAQVTSFRDRSPAFLLTRKLSTLCSINAPTRPAPAW